MSQPITASQGNFLYVTDKKMAWTEKEDAIVRRVYRENKLPLFPNYITNRRVLAKPLFKDEPINRKVKFIVERWETTLSPAIKHGFYTPPELACIRKWYPILGSKWSQLSKKIFEEVGHTEGLYRPAQRLKNNKKIIESMFDKKDPSLSAPRKKQKTREIPSSEPKIQKDPEPPVVPRSSRDIFNEIFGEDD